MRRTIRLIILAAMLLWSVAMPIGSALAASSSSSAASSPNAAANLGNPFQLGSGGQVVTQVVTTPATPSSSSTSSSSFSGLDALIIAIVAFGLIGGVAVYVWRDSRHHARLTTSDGDYFGDGPRKGSKAPRKSRKLSAAERKRRKRGRAR